MRSRGVTAIAVLALIQGVLGLLRSLQWFQIGGDLSRTGVLLIPIVGVAALVRGGFVALIAVLYVLFAWGLFSGKPWAWSVGLAACVVNAVAVVGLIVAGDSLGAALFWAVVPVIVGIYLLRTGRRSLAA
jgi:hypothetical protein